jgi:HlyD family secretion protein
MNNLPSIVKNNQKLLGQLALVVVISGGIVGVGLFQGNRWMAQPTDPEATQPETPPGVAALGRLEPAGEIIQVAAPLALDGDRLKELQVQVGDTVQGGQTIAVLDSQDRLRDEVIQAQTQVRLAQARLAQVQAGAKPGAIAAQKATVVQVSSDVAGQIQVQQQVLAGIQAQYAGDKSAQTATVKRLEAELKTAESELERYRTLYGEGAISASLYDSKQLSVTVTRQQHQEAIAILQRIESTAQRQIQEAQAELARLQSAGSAQLAAAQSSLAEVAEVRSVDLQIAQAELENAQAALLKAQNNLAKATIKAPQPGRVLEIYTRPGEQVSDDGIVALGQTDQMWAIAEVYQSDIGRVRVGQVAQIQGQAFEGQLSGQVVEIGQQIRRQNVFSNEPGENLDRRVVEVKVALSPEASQRVASFSNLQVQVVIDVASPEPPSN